MTCYKKAIFHAILAAALYAINAPFSKLLLTEIPSTMMAGLLYLGAGSGMFLLEKLNRRTDELPLARKELPYTAAMVALDIAAPIFLMIGLIGCSAANASLLNNFEIVASFIGAGLSLLIFHERPSGVFVIALLIMAVGTYLASAGEE